MTDLMLRAPSLDDLMSWGILHPSYLTLATEEDDGEGGTVNVLRPGVTMSPWAGTGRLQLSLGEGYDPETGEWATPPVYDTYYTVLMRFSNPYATADAQTADAPPGGVLNEPAWELTESRLGQYMGMYGTEQIWNTITNFELDNVQMLIQEEYQLWREANGLPNHGYL